MGTAASAGGPLGTVLTDTATVSGGNSPTGTVTFALYGPNNASCTGVPIFTSTNPLVAGSATSGPFTPTAPGVYRWTALYSGDAGNNPVLHPCNSPNESATITPSTPTIATVASTGGPIGTVLSDTATVSGGTNPTGTVTFNLYGPNDASCSGAAIFSSTVALVGRQRDVGVVHADGGGRLSVDRELQRRREQQRRHASSATRPTSRRRSPC